MYINNIHFDRWIASTGSCDNIDGNDSDIGGGNDNGWRFGFGNNNNNVQSLTNHVNIKC